MGHDEQAMATATPSAPSANRKQQQRLRHKLLETLLPDLQRFVQRVVGDADRSKMQPSSSSVKHEHEHEHDTDPLQATDRSTSSSEEDSDIAVMDVHTRLQHVRDDWRPSLEAAGCDARVLELVDKALGHESDDCEEQLESLARAIDASDVAQAQFRALASELAALRMREGGAAWRVSDTHAESDDVVTKTLATASIHGTAPQFDGSDATLERSSSNTLRSAVVVDAAIQCRASAGHAVAQRFVAAHELAAQAQTFVRERQHDRALETIRRAVVLWRRVAVAPRLLNTLLRIANDRVASADAADAASDSADPCFVFAIGEDSAEAELVSTRHRANTQRTGSASSTHTTTDAGHDVFWRQCVAAYPRVAVFQFWLAQRLYDSGKVRDARVFVDKALALEPNPQWLYLRARCLAAQLTTSLAHRVDAFRQYIATNPPDEAFVPEAYYSLALLYLEQGEYALAKQYQALAQLAERPPVRFPTFGLVADDFAPKRMLRVAFSAPLLVLSLAQQRACVGESELACECCGQWMPLLTLLHHKMEVCAQRPVGCLLCGASMAPELLLPHQEHVHSPS